MLLAVPEGKGDGKGYADQAEDVGGKSAGGTRIAFGGKQIPQQVHEQMQEDGHPQIEVPFHIHPTEVKGADECYGKNNQSRNQVCALIQVY